ncbi:hypothetical protein AOQ84DRAFT_389488 [Glonium stellatum]|uniref:Uncharacterized protein n=1 Tax=Glonium stellatum TaxID=574774 RepID=A0A8E2EZL4_9PEZI|nr:hypothetical protein AOQ84DRAFT_389488 [Glonium stellatum]
MSRFFSTTARNLLKWLGFDRTELPPSWRSAVEKFAGPGGGAEQRLGPVNSIYIKSRQGNPLHQSHFNRADKRTVISAEISARNGKKVCHIFEDGSGTTKKGEDPL